jgi:hypothetical protein
LYLQNKALLASFFILGMGLFAPVASIWQSMDYLNAQFEVSSSSSSSSI